jgi:SAM-dependent methyltransferase
MGQIVYGLEPELFGPRHAHREHRILRVVRECAGAPGLHLECAAGVGSLAMALARAGKTVVAADLSLRSLAVIRRCAQDNGLEQQVLPVVADLTCLPFADQTFASASSAETLEHIADDQQAADELARTIEHGGWLAGTVPAAAGRWQEWDEWAGHLRRYTVATMGGLLARAGLEPVVTTWGWPLLRLYDALFLNRVNRRRLRQPEASAGSDPALRAVSRLGRTTWLVNLVRRLFELDRLFDGARWGVGLLFVARRGSGTPSAGEGDKHEPEASAT